MTLLLQREPNHILPIGVYRYNAESEHLNVWTDGNRRILTASGSTPHIRSIPQAIPSGRNAE